MLDHVWQYPRTPLAGLEWFADSDWAPIPCPRCASDLAGLPEQASYCPHCGLPLEDPDLRARLQRHNADIPAHTSIVHGYAHALFRLGRRYETGLGASRHEAEARRCYFKAAKLGSAPARDRMKNGQ